MSVRIEFFGIPRERAGVIALELEATTLGEVFSELAVRLPEFATACLQDRQLAKGMLANINGRTFTSDPARPLAEGDCVLILSSDAGG